MAIDVASPFNDGTEDNLQMRSLGKEELLVAEKREQNEQWWKELQQLVSRLLGQANRGSHGSIMSDMNTRKTGLY